MKNRERLLRTLLVVAFWPAVFIVIAMVVVIRPLTAYEDGFYGPEDMWRDVLRWRRTGELWFPSWQRASRDRLPHRQREKQPVSYRRAS